jgi:serine protease Do
MKFEEDIIMDNNNRLNDENNKDISEVEKTLVQGDEFVMEINSGENNQYSGESYTVSDDLKYDEKKEEVNMSSSSNDSYQKSSNYIDADPVDQKVKKKRRSSFNKKVLSYVLVGLICTTIGGVATGFASLYALPNTEFFKSTPLYQSINGNGNNSVNSAAIVADLNHPTKLSTSAEALSVAEINKKVGPAVVGVSTKSISATSRYYGQAAEGMGSGIIINEEGYVLTNHHVIENAQEVKVILSDGKEVAAKVMNSDSTLDIAVVKITENIKMPAVAELGISGSLQVGEDVVAIGNPLGKEFLGTVTNGIVSAVNRQLDENGIKYIQTNTAINSGNSGGPLINSRGQVIGINTAKIGQTGVEGLGFAIPIDSVKDKIENLSKPVLMIGIVSDRVIDEATSKQLTEKYKVDFPVGVYITDVVEFSAAEKAGVKIGDIVTKFDGQKVKTVAEINTLKLKHKSGDTIKVEVNRDGKSKELELKLAE